MKNSINIIITTMYKRKPLTRAVPTIACPGSDIFLLMVATPYNHATDYGVNGFRRSLQRSLRSNHSLWVLCKFSVGEIIA